MLNSLRKDLKKLSNKKKASIMQRFFKTGEGEYGFGDVFVGISVPQSRELAIKYKDITFIDVSNLLESKVHEERLIALLILVHKFQTEPLEQRRIYDFYIKNTKHINNWDLVDLSSDKIIGGYLIDKPKDILLKFAKSNNLWERRIAMISTYNFIKNNHFKEALKIAEVLVGDKNDLIQKAVGWMIREVGKRNKDAEIKFLNKYYKKMGRTALRYSIEKFPEVLRKKYLLGKA
ncbi:MAG: DNA alkylation repair protein [Candidatus Levybacteria bacterium RBG_13_35_9]|nr:MAG: DNA alkylation repair protein [Candidatus Levybacteria bacterium RBG_13_35_9]